MKNKKLEIYDDFDLLEEENEIDDPENLNDNNLFYFRWTYNPPTLPATWYAATICNVVKFD